MLIAYQAKINGNQIHWIDTPPNVSDVEVLILPKQQVGENVPKPKRTPPPELKGVMTFDDSIWDNDEMSAEWEESFDKLENFQ